MATVNFSAPEDFNSAFNAMFKGQNNSAVTSDLMREAVERAQQKRRCQAAYLNILERRRRAPSVTDAQIRKARERGRPSFW